MFKKIVLSDIKVGGNTPTYNANRPLVPYVDVLPEGKYTSEIKSIGVIGDEASGIAVVHTLTDSAGNTYQVNFCYYGEKVNALIDGLGGSGFKGAIADVVGYKEVVMIAHGNKYAYISARKKLNTSETDDESAATTNSDSGVEYSDTDENTPRVRRKSGLLSYRRKGKNSRIDDLLSDDEDEPSDDSDDLDEDDFLDEE